MAMAEGTVEDAVRTIRAMDREFMDNVAAKNAAQVAAIYTGDARILMPGQPVIVGKSQMLAFYEAAREERGKFVAVYRRQPRSNKLRAHGTCPLCPEPNPRPHT